MAMADIMATSLIILIICCSREIGQLCRTQMSVLMINKMIPEVAFLILLNSVCSVVILSDVELFDGNKEMILVYTDWNCVWACQTRTCLFQTANLWLGSNGVLYVA